MMMTLGTAKYMMGIKPNDKLDADGIKNLIDSRHEYLKVWSISKADRRKAEKEIEALLVLYNESLKTRK